MRPEPTMIRNEERDVCVESDALSYYTAEKSEVESFISDLVSNKSSLIVCKEALAALPVTIRDNTVKQFFTVAKTYRILQSQVKAVSKLTPSDSANDLSHLPGNLKDLKKFDLKGYVRVRGELRFTQTVQRCEEIIARF